MRDLDADLEKVEEGNRAYDAIEQVQIYQRKVSQILSLLEDVFLALDVGKGVKEAVEAFEKKLCEGEHDIQAYVVRPINYDGLVMQTVFSGPEIRKLGGSNASMKDFVDSRGSAMLNKHKVQLLQAFYEWKAEMQGATTKGGDK
jgi:hypothetical protein